jgi:hypothetical protein
MRRGRPVVGKADAIDNKAGGDLLLELDAAPTRPRAQGRRHKEVVAEEAAPAFLLS